MDLKEAFVKIGVEVPDELCVSQLQQAAESRRINLSELLVELSAALQGWEEPPPPVAEHFREGVPLPRGLTVPSLREAMKFTQRLLSLLNTQTLWLSNLKLTGIIQTNNFSGMLSNILTEGLSRFSDFQRHSDQKHPDLKNPLTGEGLEVKATLDPNKGGEGHNGLGGWHLIASYSFSQSGNIRFSSVKVAYLEAYQEDEPIEKSDWKYLGSKLKRKTGTRRTETFVTTRRGTWKLRHGTVYLDPELWPNWKRLRPPREIEIPPYSPWYEIASAQERGRLP